MKKLRILDIACACLLLFVIPNSANSTLIGDVITAEHHFPEIDLPYGFGTYSTTAQIGASDIMCPYASDCLTYYSVNVEADSILIDFNASAPWNTNANFNGVFIDSLNDSSGNALAGVAVNTDALNWYSSMLTFDDDSIWVNFVDPYEFILTPSGGNVVHIELSTNFNASAIPEPSILWLLSSSLLALIWIERRKSAV